MTKTSTAHKAIKLEVAYPRILTISPPLPFKAKAKQIKGRVTGNK